MERDRIRAVTEFSRDLAMDASAGTGKTATLVARVTNLFLAKPELPTDRVLLLTFTDKAAAEMRSRIQAGWEQLLAACRSCGSLEEAAERIAAVHPLFRLPPAGAYGTPEALVLRAEEMADGVGRLSVTTFHSFCRRLLLSFPAEAGVDPRFEVLSEGEAAEAWEEAFTRFLRSEFGREETDPAWERILSTSASQEAVFGMIRRLCLLHRDLLGEGAPDFGTPADLLGYLRDRYAAPAAWFREFVSGIVDREHDMVPRLGEALSHLRAGWEAVERSDLEEAVALAPRGLALFDFPANRIRSGKRFPMPPGCTLADARDRLREFWRALAEVPSGDASARFLVGRALASLREYERAKAGRLDFLDLLLRAHRLLRDSPAVARRVSERFRYLFVDEFQDTDPLQAGMLEGIAAAAPRPGRLFLVGDPKQSIYGFRRADVQVYRRFRDALLAGGGESVELVRNFRSRPGLVAAVHGIFRSLFTGREDFDPPCPPVAAARTDAGPDPPVTFFSLGEDAPEPEFLCTLIRRIVGRVPVGGTKGEPERPASYRDIAVLYRSDPGGELLAAFRSAFDAAGIPFVVPSRRGFYARQEVQDLRMVLQAVDAPADPSARYAALKTIFFGLSDEEILPAFAGDGGAVSPRVADALGVLSRASARRGRTSLSALIADLYRETGVEFIAARLPEGERILQNLARAREMAFASEWGGRGSLKGFLAEIRRKTEAESPEQEIPPFGEEEDAVRISTIHLAKGLEFPVVILSNLSRGRKRAPEGLRVDRVRGLFAVLFPGIRTYSAFRMVTVAGGTIPYGELEERKDEAEERRLLYVAATRAKDRLFLVEGARGRGSALQKALHASLAAAADAGEGRCAVTGLVGRRLRFPAGESPDSPEGELLRVEVAGPLREADRPESRGTDPVEAPAPKSFPVPPVPAASVDLPVAPERIPLREFADRAAGRRFGERVHRLLEAIPPVVSPWPPRGTPPASWTREERARWERIRDAIRESPLYRELRRSVLVGTELPLATFRGGWSREERADLVVRDPGDPATGVPPAYRVIDYKTGVREEGEEEVYRDQVRRYVRALSAAWNVPVRGTVWYIETGETVEVDPETHHPGGADDVPEAE
ncbi:MAG: hypothetical protein Kow00128_23350 [Deltaproteobacteria bacterium]